MTVTLYLVRHGETTHNEGGRGLGREDAELTPLGEIQVRMVSEKLSQVAVDRVLSSPLSRAALMARAIAEATGCEVELRDELIELDVGDTEGITFAEMRERFPEFMKDWASADPTNVRMPGGESLLDLAARTSVLVDELHRLDGQTIVAVAHNFVIKVLLCQLLDLPLSNFRRFQIDLASVSALSLRDGRAAVLSLNDICHVETLNLA